MCLPFEVYIIRDKIGAARWSREGTVQKLIFGEQPFQFEHILETEKLKKYSFISRQRVRMSLPYHILN